MTDHQFSAEWCRAAAGCIAELEQRLAAAEARSMATKYEELRSIIDGGSETMTHEDAVQDLKDRADERDELQRKLAAAEAALKLRTAELAACKSACQGEMESADEYKAERDECRRLLREACEYVATAGFNDAMITRWAERAAKAAGGVEP